MKKLLFLLFLIFLFSCQKKDIIKSCEENQTFTLFFRNYYGYVHTLFIDDKQYYMEKETETLSFIVPVNKINTVCISKSTDPTIKCCYMIGKPNACANYNYFW
jgi:hypothetical protein